MSSNIKLIVLVRNPIDSIESIMKLTAKYYEPWDYEKSSGYYLERLKFLDKVCSQKKNEDLLFINSDMLIQSTEDTLGLISKFLELPSNLSSDYSKFSFTGIKGDPSKNIQSGQIQNDGKISTEWIDSKELVCLGYKELLAKYT